MFSPHSLLLFATSILLPTSKADFHLDNVHYTQSLDNIDYYSPVACASNNWNCDCFGTSHLAQNGAGWISNGNLDDDFFTIDSGFCGQGQLNFYRNDNGGFDFYHDGGDGSVVGSCWTNWETADCWEAFGHAGFAGDEYVCYTDICS